MLCSRCEKVFSGQCDKSLNEPGLWGEWYVLFRIDSLFPTLEHPDCQLCFLLARSYRNDHEKAQLWATAGQTYWGWETNPVVEYDIGPFDPVLGFELSFRLAVPIACGTGVQSGEIIRQWPSIGASMLCLLSVRVEELFNDHLSKLLLTHRQCCKSNYNFGAQVISVCLTPLMMNRAGIYSKNGFSNVR
jgi:hypothetical protein